MSFLFLYYAVLIERRQDAVGVFEAVMYVWIVAFAYDELSGIIDAGVIFYQMDFWSLWNVSIIGVGIAFVVTSESSSAQSALRLVGRSSVLMVRLMRTPQGLSG